MNLILPNMCVCDCVWSAFCQCVLLKPILYCRTSNEYCIVELLGNFSAIKQRQVRELTQLGIVGELLGEKSCQGKLESRLNRIDALGFCLHCPFSELLPS